MVEPDVEMRESGVRRVNVKSMQGQVRTVDLSADASIRDLKSKIALVFSVPPERQRLIYQGKLLKDDSRLSEYIKEDGCTVHMMVKAEDDQVRRPPPEGAPMAFPEGVQVQFVQGQPQVQFVQGQFLQPGAQFVQGQPQVQFVQSAPAAQVPQGVQARAPQNPQGQPHREERKVREIALPFNHVHNLGHIVNTLMGPNASFPHPPMPQLPVNRNTLVLLGGFLYNYQFQLMRLIPFLSRLADLLQRESLITDPQQRADLQRFSRAMGSAMHEIHLATHPVVELFQHIDIGQAPGQYQLHVHEANVVGQHEAPRPQSNASGNPAQAVIDSLLNPASLPADSPLARLAPTLQQALSGGMGNMSLRDLMLAANVHENEEDLPLMEFVYNLTMPELTALMSGDVAPLDRIRPTVADNLRAAMGGMDSPEARERILHVYDQYIHTHLVMPEQFASRQRPGFDYKEATSQIVQKAARKLIAMVLEDSSNEFGARFKREFQLRVGEWAEAIVNGMEGGAQTLDLLLRAQLQASVAEMGGEQGAALLSMSYGLLQQLLVVCLQMRRLEREAQDPVAALLDTWGRTIQADVELQARAPPQASLSRAYRALDISRASEVHPERPQAKKFLRGLLTQSLQDCSVALQGAEISSGLTDSFIDQLATDIAQRAPLNPDYDASRLRNVETLRRR